MLCLLVDDNHDKSSLITTTCCVYWLTTTRTPTIKRPHIVFTGGRQPRQIQPYYDHMLCLLTDDNDKPNHNTTTYCVHWRTTTTNPTIIRPHVVFTDGRQRQTQPNYVHMLCLLTEDNDNADHKTTTCCAYWWTTTTTNPALLRPHVVFTDWRQREPQP